MQANNACVRMEARGGERLKVLGTMRVTFARSRRGDKRIQFDSAEKGLEVHLAASTFQRRKHRRDAKHVGNVGNVGNVVDDPDDDIEHTIIQPFPIELNFVETVLFDGTLHNDGGDIWGSPLSGDDSTAPYLHRQCSVIVGDVSVTLGLPHMEAIG